MTNWGGYEAPPEYGKTDAWQEGHEKIMKSAEMKREIFEVEGRFSLMVEYADKLTARERHMIDSFLGYVSDTINKRHEKLMKEAKEGIDA